MIKFRTEKVIRVQDWDDLVKTAYGRPYTLQQQDGCMERQRISIKVPCNADDYDNNTVPEVVNGDEMGVSFKSWVERDPNQPLNSTDEWTRKYGLSLWWDRNFYPHLDMVINDLHQKGLLPEGEYIIDVDW